MTVDRWLGYRCTPKDFIPEGWELKRLRDITMKFKAGGSLGLTMADFTPEGFDTYSAEGLSGRTKIAEFDGPAIIVSSIGSKCGKSFLATRKFTTLSNVQVVFPNVDEIDPYFLWELLNDEAFWPRAQTGQPFIRPADIKKAWIPKPPNGEQKAIRLAFEHIDDDIAATKEKLVAARRLKTALMQQLFTRGIPGRHTRFKQTKIGEIPEEWEVVTIKSVLDGMPFNGVSPQSREEPPGTPILNVACVNDGICSPKNMTFVDVDEKTVEACRARAGDFYVLRGNGNREYVARGGLLKEEPGEPTIFSDKLIRLRFQPEKVVERYIPYLWQSQEFLHRIQSKAESGSGLWMISKRDIRRELFALPESKDEQREIVSLVDASIENFAAIESEVMALERLKRSLLQNLLTGKVRVKPLDVPS